VRSSTGRCIADYDFTLDIRSRRLRPLGRLLFEHTPKSLPSLRHEILTIFWDLSAAEGYRITVTESATSPLLTMAAVITAIVGRSVCYA